MNNRKEKNSLEVWEKYITSQTAKGVSDAMINNHPVSYIISKYFDIKIPMDKK